MHSRGITKRTFLKTAAGAALGRAAEERGRAAEAPSPPPNFIYINADDLGYGDLGCYGSRIATPNLDAMASRGVRFRQFYSASALCSPSRAALLTGRYPTRVGVPNVLVPESTSGLAETELTIAQVLKATNYRTMCIGKWHLGSQPQYLPTSRGFDQYFGIPYSNDMWPLVLMRNSSVIENPTNLDTLAGKYTDQAIQFIAASRDTPFFLYFAPAIPHLPLAASSRFRCRSALGMYGDAVEELDWSVGQVWQALVDQGLAEQTLVMFSSDNGPWFQGSAGRLRGRKAETFEGGHRVPFLACLPGRIPSGVEIAGMATTMDVLPTLARLAGAPLPPRPLDGVDIWPLLTGEASEVEREAFLYFSGWNAQCARLGRWKLHVARPNTPPWTPEPKVGCFNLPLPRPELYDLEADPEESYDTAGDNPQIVAEIRARIEALLFTFPDQVRTAWRDTMSRAVEGTNAGQWPVLRAG